MYHIPRKTNERKIDKVKHSILSSIRKYKLYNCPFSKSTMKQFRYLPSPESVVAADDLIDEEELDDDVDEVGELDEEVHKGGAPSAAAILGRSPAFFDVRGKSHDAFLSIFPEDDAQSLRLRYHSVQIHS